MGRWKAVITGASGLLGRAVVKEFNHYPEKWEVTGFAFSRAGDNLVQVDLRSEKAVESSLEEIKPDVIIHCAAERRPNIAEKQEDLTHQLNVAATSFIANSAKKLGSYLIYISTDYVFDGSAHPYKPRDTPNPLNKYGESKLKGEKAALDIAGHAAVLRVPILYGEVEKLEESAVTCLFDILKKQEKVEVSDYEIRQPTHTQDVASVCRQMCELQLNSPGSCSGIFHWGSKEALTKYEMVKIMAELFTLPIDHITASKDPSSGAKRPFNCQLDCSDLTRQGIASYTTFKEGIKSCLAPFS